MSTSEQHIIKNVARTSKSRFVRRGTPLAYKKSVNRKYTYRELTMILGVFVALIVALTIWAAQKRSLVADQKVKSPAHLMPAGVVEFVANAIHATLPEFKIEN